MLPELSDNDPKASRIQGRFFDFMQGEHWVEVLSLVDQAKNDPMSNTLLHAIQVVMVEVGYQHWFRNQLVELMEPDQSTAESLLSAAQDLVRTPAERSASPAPVVQQGALDAGEVELAIQRVLARVAAVPSELGVTEFLELSSQLAREIIDEQVHGLPEEVPRSNRGTGRTPL